MNQVVKLSIIMSIFFAVACEKDDPIPVPPEIMMEMVI